MSTSIYRSIKAMETCNSLEGLQPEAAGPVTEEELLPVPATPTPTPSASESFPVKQGGGGGEGEGGRDSQVS